MRHLVLAALLACTLPGAAVAAGTTAAGEAGILGEDDFVIKDTQDYVEVCSAAPADAIYTAAINFCHGYGVGAYQYYLALVAGNPDMRFVCPPLSAPPRSEVIDGFVTWAKANSQHLGDPAVDSIFRYLAQRFPCNP